MTAVISLDTQTFLGHNQETYQDLQLALQLNLRRQLLLAVCDDVALQTQLARRLEVDLNPFDLNTNLAKKGRGEGSPIVTLRLDIDKPDLVRQVLLWLKQHRLLKASAKTIPAFQILGLEQLTRRSPTLQNKFLASLIHVDALITRLDCRLLIWVPRPWLGKIQQIVPSFWRSRSGLFEFAGDPTPTDNLPPAFEHLPTLPTRPPVLNSRVSAQNLSRQTQTGQASASPQSDNPPVANNAAQAHPPGEAQNLWTILREDLSAFEQGADSADAEPVAHPLVDLAAPSAAEPDAPPLPLQVYDSADYTPSHGASHFTVMGDAPLATVIMPPGSPPADGLYGGEVSTEPLAAVEHHSAAADAVATPPNPKDTVSSTPAVAPSPPASHGLPAELAQDEEALQIWHYAQTLEAQQAGPLTLSRAYLGLGQLSRDHIEAGVMTLPLLEFAMDAYRRAIPGLLEGEDNWCDALNDLASLYWLRSQQNEAPDAIIDWLHLSVNAYQKALKGTPTGTNPETILRLCSNLGTVYSLLANLTDPLAHLQQSQKAYERALHHAPVSTLPLEYANLQNSLGAIHWRLAQLDQPQHYLHQAIVAYSEALRYRNPQAAPLEYAMIQNNLGIAYWSLAQHQHPRLLLEKAVAAYQAALQYRTVEESPQGCAATNNNLGTAYWDLAQQHPRHPEQRLHCLRQSITAYENALQAAEVALNQTPGLSLGFDMWATLHSAGVVHDQLAQGLPANQAEQRQRHLQQALQHYLLAYQGWQDNPQQLEVLVAAMVYNVHLSFEILGLPGQQAVLSQLPGELLPQILGQL